MEGKLRLEVKSSELEPARYFPLPPRVTAGLKSYADVSDPSPHGDTLLSGQPRRRDLTTCLIFKTFAQP